MVCRADHDCVDQSDVRSRRAEWGLGYIEARSFPVLIQAASTGTAVHGASALLRRSKARDGLERVQGELPHA